MIYVDLKGNLGNQLFEYALARKIQEETGQKICINTAFLKKYKPEYTCDLDKYILNENVIFEDEKELPWYVNTYAGPIRYIKKVFPKLFFNISVKYGNFIWLHENYVKLPILPEKKNYRLVGYWQSTKYFANINPILRKEFTPKEPENPLNKELYNVIRNRESVCVTIRRGDYVTNEKYKKQFYLCGSEFFLEGIKRIKRDIPNCVIIFFSDDIEWVKENIKVDGKVYYETGNDSVFEKLRLMSECKHFIISNSTFSWWAQHLSSNPNKIVYAPSRWFPDGRECDIYEKNWRYIKID